MTKDEQIVATLHSIELELRTIRRSAGVARPLRAVMWGTIWAAFWMGLAAVVVWRVTDVVETDRHIRERMGMTPTVEFRVP